jgi:hypothetical protein
VPIHTFVPGDDEILTLAGTVGVTVIVIELDVTVEVAGQAKFGVITHVTL